MKNSEPIYMCMRKYLIEIIDKNKHIDDFKLPSENQLARKFNASRISAKHAMMSLQKDKLIYRRQGKGTFISPEVKEMTFSIEEEERLTIGLIIPGVQGRFISKIAEGIEDYLQHKQIHLMIMTTRWEIELEEKMIQVAIKNNCKGLILLPVATNEVNKQIVTLGLNLFPMVLVDRYVPHLDISYVACNHYTAANNGIKYLISKGHREIGFISQDPETTSSVKDRILGYEDALKEMYGEQHYTHILISDHNAPDFEARLKNYFDEHPQITALMTTSTGYGRKVIREVQSRQLKVPEDIIIMFFDNEFEEYADLLTVKPIIINQNPYKIGWEAAKLLYRLLYQNPKPKKVLLEEEIIEV